MTIDDPEQIRRMLAAFEARDRSQDGRFVVAVTTTGIYCRPSCPARRPRIENVRFFADEASAAAEGFRPCKRCKPDEAARDEQAVRAAIEAIRTAEAPLPLERIAALAGYSPTHFQRVFKRQTGLSPAGYARALREDRARDALSETGSVGQAIYEAGFEAPSRFYQALEGKLGMAPSVWAKGGAGVTIRWAVVRTSLAPMLVAATDKGVCRLSFNEGRDDLAERFPNAELVEGGEDFAELLAGVVAAVETPGTGADIPLDVKGTAFQERVWQELRRVPRSRRRRVGPGRCAPPARQTARTTSRC